jgi:hypothetical protein
MSSHGLGSPGVTLDELRALQSSSGAPAGAQLDVAAASPCGKDTLTSTPWLLVLGAALEPLLTRYQARVDDVKDASGKVVARRLVLTTIQSRALGPRVGDKG